MSVAERPSPQTAVTSRRRTFFATLASASPRLTASPSTCTNCFRTFVAREADPRSTSRDTNAATCSARS